MATGSGLDLATPFDPLQPFSTLFQDVENQPTATGVPTLYPPALGSEARAFAAWYGLGTPPAIGDAAVQYRLPLAGHLVDLRIQVGPGTDRQGRVVMITASDPALQGWEAATADAVCATFLPRDAHLRTFDHTGGQTEYIYVSASLATVFFPAAFVTDSGEPSAPGTFSRLDQPAPGPAPGVIACTLALGQHS
jgi:hypothetical protein